MNFIDGFLNKFTMYKVVLYGLTFLAFVTLILSLFEVIFYNPFRLVSSFVILSAACFGINLVFAKIFKVPANPESSFITALILFFIMVPISKTSEIWIYILAALLAMGSKYILAIHKKHIFNPAAFALVVIGLLGLPQINWWVGNSHLFPFVLIVGLLVVRKVRRLSMFSVYFIFALVSIAAFAFMNNREVSKVLVEAILSYPVLFLGTIMLVEPFTSPPRRTQQLIYGGIVGLLSGAQYHIGPIFSSPELGLLVGNLYSYLVSFRERLFLKFIDKKEIASGIFEFTFSKNKNFAFVPGEYMEWTLPGVKFDIRGIRRFFTIASSPTEENIKIAVRISEHGSKFKQRLLELKKDEKIFAGTLSGDFVLPKKEGKYVFIAGGIGITPFRSIVKNAIDNGRKLDAILFYSCSEEGEFAYQDLFDSAFKVGLKTIYVCSHPGANFKGVKGRLDAEIIRKDVPDFKERIFYLSGPNALVVAYKKLLRSLGIRPDKIITDYFSGY